MDWQSATAQLSVTGMTCNGCVSAVRNTLKGVPGVEDADVDLDAGRAKVTYDPSRTSVEAMIAAVAQLGYQAEVEGTLVE